MADRRITSAGDFRITAASDARIVAYYISLLTPADAGNTDDTPTFEFVGVDPQAEDVRYEIQIDSVPTFDSGAVNTDSYSESNFDNSSDHTTVNNRIGTGQGFTGDGSLLLGASFFLGRSAAGSAGTFRFRLYAHSGTFGTSGIPTGAVLAETSVVDMSTLGVYPPLGMVQLAFTTPFQSVAATKYFITCEGAPSVSALMVGTDTSSPSHGGNIATLVGSTWTASSASDVCFIVQGMFPPTLDKVSGTDAGFLNTISGGDTDPFNSGEQVSFTVQAGDELSDGTWYWRVRAKDPTGRNIWSDWSETRSFDSAAVSDVIVTMGAASLVLSAFAPTVLTPTTVTPTNAALVTTTFAPTVLTPVTATLGKLTVVTASFAPTVLAPRTVTMDVAALATATFAPTVSTPILATVGVQALTTTPFAPTVSTTANQFITMSTAGLTIASFAPTVTASDHKLVTMGAGSLTTTTFAPSATITTLVVMGVASLTTTTFAPTIVTPVLVTMGTLVLTTSTFAPSVLVTVLVTMGPATLTTATFSPTVLTPVVATLGKLSVATATFAPSVSLGFNVVMNKATLTTTTFAPTVSTPQTVVMATAALTLTEMDLVVGGVVTVTMAKASLVLTTFAPTIAVPVVATPSPAALVISTFAPLVVATNHILVIMGTAALVLTTYEMTTGSPFGEAIAVITRRGSYTATMSRTMQDGTTVIRRDPNLGDASQLGEITATVVRRES